jgi:transposase-like protein
MVERRKFSPEFKARVVLELISGKKGLMEASRDYGIKDTVLSRWKQEFIERAPQVFEQPKPEGQEKELAELERMVGRLTIQLDMAKKVLGYSGFPPKENE